MKHYSYLNEGAIEERDVLLDILRPKTEYVDRDVNVTINKPSTAEDLRLLKEMQEQAEKSVIDKHISTLANNDMNFVNIIQDYDCQVNQRYLLCAFKLNGKDFRFKIDVSERFIAAQSDRNAIIQDVRNKIISAIAEQLFVSLDFLPSAIYF